MKIGFFDSGIGGLTVLHQAMKMLPGEDYIYYADTDHVPYGTKSKEEIIGYVNTAVEFLIHQGVKAIVIACNTATSVAIEYLREKYTLPILGMEPAVKPAVEKHSMKRAMVIATPLTVREDKLKNLLQQIDEDHKIDLLPLPQLVMFAESDDFETAEVENYLRKEFAPYCLEEYSTLVLGCTHFNYFKDTLRRIFPQEVEFIDGSEGTINHLKNILQEKKLLEHNTGKVEYYLSGVLVTDKDILARFTRLQERLERMIS